MTRRNDWTSRLRDYIDATKLGSFAHGELDCALWVLGAVDAMRGTNVVAGYVGKYDDMLGAQRMLLERGWSNLLDAALKVFGSEPQPDLAQLIDGDVVWFPPSFGTRRLRLGETFGQGILGLMDSGLVWLPAEPRLLRVPSGICASQKCIGVPVR